MAAALTTPQSQNAHWSQTEGMRGAINGTLQRSISHLFLASPQMWRDEAGEGYIEGTAFVTAAVITSKMLLCSNFSSPLSSTKIQTPKHTHNGGEGKKTRASVHGVNAD